MDSRMPKSSGAPAAVSASFKLLPHRGNAAFACIPPRSRIDGTQSECSRASARANCFAGRSNIIARRHQSKNTQIGFEERAQAVARAQSLRLVTTERAGLCANAVFGHSGHHEVDRGIHRKKASRAIDRYDQDSDDLESPVSVACARHVGPFTYAALTTPHACDVAIETGARRGSDVAGRTSCTRRAAHRACRPSRRSFRRMLFFRGLACRSFHHLLPAILRRGPTTNGSCCESPSFDLLISPANRRHRRAGSTG